MIVSTRGRYALRVLLDLAEHRSAAYIPMKDVTARQGISQKYIEQIMPVLVKAGFVEGVHGKGGGYRLARAPEDCPVGEILRLTEGDLAPVSCLSADCRTIGMWTRFNEITNEYFDAISLADLLRQ